MIATKEVRQPALPGSGDHQVARKIHVFAPIIVGARGIWPRINNERADVLRIPASLPRSCVNSALKWRSTIHRAFSKAIAHKTN
jgi:hypothetical protein